MFQSYPKNCHWIMLIINIIHTMTFISLFYFILMFLQPFLFFDPQNKCALLTSLLISHQSAATYILYYKYRVVFTWVANLICVYFGLMYLVLWHSVKNCSKLLLLPFPPNNIFFYKLSFYHNPVWNKCNNIN